MESRLCSGALSHGTPFRELASREVASGEIASLASLISPTSHQEPSIFPNPQGSEAKPKRVKLRGGKRAPRIDSTLRFSLMSCCYTACVNPIKETPRDTGIRGTLRGLELFAAEFSVSNFLWNFRSETFPHSLRIRLAQVRSIREIEVNSHKATAVISIGIALLLLIGGCATSRGVLKVQPIASVNPSTGPEVKIVEVKDSREFQLKPPKPSIPSLKDGDINNPAKTSRAIARKRNGYGMALGDILLPEGQSVSGLASAALVRGLRASGYRVLEKGDPGYANAVPLVVEVQQFWAWFSPGFWSANLDFLATISVTGPLAPFTDGELFEGEIRLSTQVANTRAWMNTVTKGLDNLNADIQKKLSM